jgi:hypothetical protein
MPMVHLWTPCWSLPFAYHQTRYRCAHCISISRQHAEVWEESAKVHAAHFPVLSPTSSLL